MLLKSALTSAAMETGNTSTLRTPAIVVAIICQTTSSTVAGVSCSTVAGVLTTEDMESVGEGSVDLSLSCVAFFAFCSVQLCSVTAFPDGVLSFVSHLAVSRRYVLFLSCHLRSLVFTHTNNSSLHSYHIHLYGTCFLFLIAFIQTQIAR